MFIEGKTQRMLASIDTETKINTRGLDYKDNRKEPHKEQQPSANVTSELSEPVKWLMVYPL